MGYRHYVTLDDRNRVTDGWSTGEHPGCGPGEHDAFIGEGGEAFALNGVEHPALKTDDEDKIPLYAWTGEAVRVRTEEEIDGDRPQEPGPAKPSDMERLEAQLMYTALMTDTLLDEEE